MAERNPTGYLTIRHAGASWHLFPDGRLRPILRGGAGTDDGEALSVPDDVSGVSDDDLRALHARLQERYDSLRPEASSSEHIAELRSLRDGQRRIAETLTQRATEAAEAQQALAELDEVPALPEPATEPTEPEQQQPAPAAPNATTPAPTPEAVAAALPTAAEIAANQAPQSATERQPAPARTRPRVAMTAAAGQQVRPFGSEVDAQAIGEIIEAVKHGVRPSSENRNPRVMVASLPAFEETPGLGVELLSMSNGVATNDRLIREAVEAWRARMWPDRYPAQTAAICEPLDIIREIPDLSTARDPFGESLPSRPAGRLGFQFTQPVTLASTAAGVQAGWTDTDQALVDPDDPSTWKPCVHVECLSPQSVTASAVSACFSFDVTTELSNPETVRDFQAKLDAQLVRQRTIMLLGIVDNIASLNGGANTDTGIYGTWPAVVSALNRWLARAVYDERLEVSEYTIYLPPGLVEGLVIDRVSRAYVTNEEAAGSIADALRLLQASTGVNSVVQLLDDITSPFGAGMANGALPRLPEVNTIRIIPPAGALYFSTGQQNTGIESDPQLARQNRRQWFSEEFVGLAKHGSAPWGTLDLTVCESGARAGLLEPACE